MNEKDFLQSDATRRMILNFESEPLDNAGPLSGDGRVIPTARAVSQFHTKCTIGMQKNAKILIFILICMKDWTDIRTPALRFKGKPSQHPTR